MLTVSQMKAAKDEHFLCVHVVDATVI